MQQSSRIIWIFRDTIINSQIKTISPSHRAKVAEKLFRSICLISKLFPAALPCGSEFSECHLSDNGQKTHIFYQVLWLENSEPWLLNWQTLLTCLRKIIVWGNIKIPEKERKVCNRSWAEDFFACLRPVRWLRSKKQVIVSYCREIRRWGGKTI